MAMSTKTVSAMFALQPPIARERTDGATVHVFIFKKFFEQGLQIFRGDRQHHPFLGFREPNFPGGDAVVFEGNPFQVYFRPGLFAHLTNGG
jgi:hypothetical protein